MKHSATRILSLVIAALLVLSLAACGGKTTTQTDTPKTDAPKTDAPKTDAPATGGVNAVTEDNTKKDAGDRDLSLITLAMSNEPTTLDLQTISVGGNRHSSELIMSTLLKMSEDGKTLQPFAAESYEWVDESTLKLKIRKDVTSSTGEKFTANDALFVLQRGAECAALGNKYGYFDIANSYVEDDYTLVLKLPKPFANAPYLLTIGCFCMYTKADFEKVGQEAWSDHPIGIGPYTLESWNRGSDMTFVRRADWWYEEPATYEKLKMIFISDANSRSLAVQSGDVDMCDAVTYAIAKSAVEADSKISAWSKVTNRSIVFWFNCDRFDVKVRKALNLAVDKDALAATLTNGTGLGSTGWFHHNSPYYVPRDPSYDPEQAKALLAEAGCPNLEFTMEVLNGDQTYADTAQILQGMYEAIGVTMHIDMCDRGVFFPKVTSPESDYDCYLINCSGFVPDDGLSFFQGANIHGNGNNGNYVSARFDELYAASQAEFDDAKRGEIYKQIDELFNEEFPVCNLFEAEAQFLSTNGIRALESDSIGSMYLDHFRFAD